MFVLLDLVRESSMRGDGQIMSAFRDLQSWRRCGVALSPSRFDPKPTDGAHPSKRKDSGFEPEVVKLLHGYATEAVKIPLSDRWQAPLATPARC